MKMRYKPITVENIDKVIKNHFVSKNALVRKPPSELPLSCRSRVSRTKKWNLIIFDYSLSSKRIHFFHINLRQK